jgi:hypothetical protein
MQPHVTVKGAGNSLDPLIQSARLWLDAIDYKEIALDVLILENTAQAGNLVLALETAVSAEGPWTTIATFGAGLCHTTKYFATREGATAQFKRLVRWKLDRSDTNLVTWRTTFRICAVLKA